MFSPLMDLFVSPEWENNWVGVGTVFGFNPIKAL